MAKTQTEQPKAEAKQPGKPPVENIRFGGVTASIWANPTKDGRTFYTVTFERAYKDGDKWANTKTFRMHDLPKLALVANKAFEKIPTIGKDAVDEEE